MKCKYKHLQLKHLGMQMPVQTSPNEKHDKHSQKSDTENVKTTSKHSTPLVLTPHFFNRWNSLSTSRLRIFFCSRNCCLCAMHQSVKELRRAKEQRETRNKTKKNENTQTNQKATKQTKNQKHHNHEKPFAASETGETGET